MGELKTRFDLECDNERELYYKTDKVALKELEYSREQLQLDLVQLKLWLKDQHHLPQSRLKESEEFLMVFLTRCKGSLEKTKEKIDAYFSLRGKSEAYRDRNVLDNYYRKTCEYFYLFFLPRPTETGDIIFISTLANRIKEFPPNAFLNCMKRLINVADICMRVHGISKPSIQLLDFGNFTPAMLSIYSPALMFDTMHILQHIFPSRTRKIILFNIPSFLEIVINTYIKPFLTKKLKDRIIITRHGFMELTKYLDKSVIPKDWQGDYPLTTKEINDIWNEHEIARKDWFLKELSELTDESKRVDNSMKYIQENSNFGVQGSLKKLAID